MRLGHHRRLNRRDWELKRRRPAEALRSGAEASLASESSRRMNRRQQAEATAAMEGEALPKEGEASLMLRKEKRRQQLGVYRCEGEIYGFR